MKIININNRLKKIATFVRQGSIVADIGTDHAYLPIWLIQNNICDSVIAGDINIAPCQRAEKNVELYKLNDKIKIIQTDGLNGIDDFHPNDIIIAGMGGELIWDIIYASEYVKYNNVKLILQPMTKVSYLRETLISNGFNIINETLADEDRRIYEIMYVEYIGFKQIYSDIELLLGKRNIENCHELFVKQVKKKIKSLELKINSMKNSNIDITYYEKLLNEMRCLI